MSEEPVDSAVDEGDDDIVFLDHAAAPAGAAPRTGRSGGGAPGEDEDGEGDGDGDDGADPIFREDLVVARPPAATAELPNPAPPVRRPERRPPQAGPRPRADGAALEPRRGGPLEPRRGAARQEGALEPPRRGAPRGRPSGRAPRPEVDGEARMTSGRQRTADAQRDPLEARLQRLSARSDDWVRRVRTAEQEQAALEQAYAGAPAAPRLDPFRGQELGGFVPERLLAYRLGCASYVALDTKTQDRVLLHVMELGHPERGGELRRVAERAERASRVEHPGLALAVGAGRTKDTAFVAHQLPLGPTLAELVERAEPLTSGAVRAMLQQVGAALEALHARQLVHGDVSLHTIRREADGSFVLSDPGLARPRTELAFLGGELLGTPGFVAPEVLDTGQVEPGADLFALGRVAWALVSRRPPPGADEHDTVSGIAVQLRDPLPAVPGVPPALNTLISKLSERDLALRYRDAAELLTDLSALDEGKNLLPRGLEDTPAASPSLREPSEPAEAPRAATVLLVLLLLLDLILAGTMGITYWRVERMPLRDPVAGYTMPLPGVSEGGYVADPQPVGPR